MEQRYGKFVVEAESGTTLEVSDGSSEALIIKAYPTVSEGEYADNFSIYTDCDGNKAIIPEGWTVSGVKKENTIWGKDVSLVIYRIPKEKTHSIDWSSEEEVENLQETYSQLVWCPVEFLDSDGTLDGKNFNQKFGRRNYRNEKFSDKAYHEYLTDDLCKQIKSVERHGGFFFSRYPITINHNCKLQSVKKGKVLDKKTQADAIIIASKMVKEEKITSHLTFGAEKDSILAWVLKTKTKTQAEIADDSTSWGNYWDSENHTRKVALTGTCEKWCANNIYDLAGNQNEWTQEKYGDNKVVIRNGNCFNQGSQHPASRRFYLSPGYRSEDVGFRYSLYID